MFERANVIREMISEYDSDLSLTQSRLDALRIRQAKYELAREFLVEHGEAQEAKRLESEIRDLGRHIESDVKLIERLTGLIETYRRALSKLEAEKSGQ